MKVEAKLQRVLSPAERPIPRHDIVLHHIERAETAFANGKVVGRFSATFHLNSARDARHGKRFHDLERRISDLAAKIEQVS
jgi:hypothetical protein